MTCESCGHLLPVHYLYRLCQDCRLLSGPIQEPDEDENGAYDDIDINHDEQNNEHEHD